MKAGTAWDGATDFFAFIKVVPIICNYKTRIKCVAALFTHAMFVVQATLIIGRHIQNSSKLSGTSCKKNKFNLHKSKFIRSKPFPDPTRAGARMGHPG